MRARIIQRGPWWYGQAYLTWQFFLSEKKHTGWTDVTGNCYTKIGARIELKRWINKHYPNEFEI